IGIHNDFHWPLRSPRVTYEIQVYQTLPRNREDLIQRIQEASRNITPAILHKVRQSFMRRVAVCLEESGGYFEHLL
ncbi:hypothetical protein ALC60_04950, partial [Trachymyrmex zeteki]